MQIVCKLYYSLNFNNLKTAIILDTRRAKKDFTFPVKLRVTFERKQKYFTTPFNLNEQIFNKVMFGKKLSEDEKYLKKRILAFENKATDIIASIPVFTWLKFEKQFLSNRGSKDSINDAFLGYITELRENERIGTAVSYECAQRSIDKFIPNARFADISPEILRKYEKWMLDQGNSATTIGIYLRPLRTLFNNAIEEGVLSREYYPFGKKYEIPTGSNVKKALNIKDIQLIYNYKPKAGSITEKAKYYWLFMYLCNGINVKDMCLLKFENIKGDILGFERAKTARTKRNVEAIRVTITDDVRKIIKLIGNPSKDRKSYIFPILKDGLTPERERQLIQQITQIINRHMKIIANDLGITRDVTTYAARHSFATILQRSGVSVEFISEALGHSNVKTTQNYLGGFEDDRKKEVAKLLTDFYKD
jgi:integrase/recombinase XerD